MSDDAPPVKRGPGRPMGGPYDGFAHHDPPEDGPHYVYRHLDINDAVLYIGVARRLFVRMGAHQAGSRWWDQIVRITAVQYPNRASAIAAETAAIKAELPIYNGTHLPMERRLIQPRPRVAWFGSKRIDVLLADVIEITPASDNERHPEDWDR